MDRSRRKFIAESVKTAGAIGIGALGLGLYTSQTCALPAQALRPPGALAEDDFLGSCVRCGLCVRDCPYDTLKLATLGETVTLGTPYFIARQVPCEMCEDIPCVVACPTGALDHQLTNIDDARMGLAVVIDQEGCLPYQGLRCEVCYNVCPVQGKAITLEKRHNRRTGMHAALIPIVHSSDCTGCGKCEQACVVDGESAIKIIPSHLAQSGGSSHYRLGWEEKQKAGGSLVTPDVKHEFNLPEGKRYDYSGDGLIDDEPSSQNETPFSANPLDTLNRKGGF